MEIDADQENKSQMFSNEFEEVQKFWELLESPWLFSFLENHLKSPVM